jgi:phosphoserine phosphatase
MSEIVDNVEAIDSKRIALMDLEGTLTPGNRNIPENADRETMEAILRGESSDGSSEVGYWSGIHLLGGEHPEDYFGRVDDWKNGDTTLDEFENRNIEIWNNLVEESNFDSAQDLLEWYNQGFLDLRSESQELVELCHEKGLDVGIISHTSTSLSMAAAEELGAEYVFPSWKFNFDGDKFARVGMEEYAEDKSLLIPELREGDVEKIVFYGNAQNDVEIANKADEAYMVENKEKVNYEKVDGFTGSFEEVLEESKEVKQF